MSGSPSATEIRRIKEFRVKADPIIAHDRCVDWNDSVGPTEEQIYEARVALLEDNPIDEPIPKATWADAVNYLSTASMDAAAINPHFCGVMTYAFKQFISQDIGADPETMLPDAFEYFPGMVPTDEPLELDEDSTPGNTPDSLVEHASNHGSRVVTEKAREDAEELREEMKRTLDKVFLEEHYDDIPFDHDVPKVFWKDAAVDASAASEENDNDDDESPQASLNMF